ncbi:MAG: radical SAM protein [Candidatus Korarchaeum sp.]|nr:radical SAM protein [Candidatus Korarchaeum sp.]
MEELPLGALRVRGWSDGCDLCWRGAKSVLFITGECPLYSSCFYCTIAEWRRGKDLIMVNERVVSNPSDVLDEVKLSSSLGIGITGGEPLLFPDRVSSYVKLLKEAFGKSFHVHIYTNSLLVDERNLSTLYDAGVDEIRFHTWNEGDWERIRLAVSTGFSVGAEIPSIPMEPWIKKLKKLSSFLDSIGAHFLNLNELEFTPSNREKLLGMGMKPRADDEVGVEGSSKAAREVLQYLERETGIMGYFCPAAQKEYQVRMRWVRRAASVAKEYETPTDEGTLIYGEVTGPESLLLLIMRSYGGSLINGTLLMDAESFERALKDLKRFNLSGKLVEVMPTEDRRILQVYPLDFVLRSRNKIR